MSINAYLVLESTVAVETDCCCIIKKLSLRPSFRLGGECDGLVHYNSLSAYGAGEFAVNVGAILDFIASAQLEPDVKTTLLEDVIGKRRDDEVRYECM